MSVTPNKASANEALQNALLLAFVEMLEASRKQHHGLDNVVLRELKGVHANTGKNDLPEHLKKALNNATHSAMGYIRSNGYVMTSTETK